VVISSKYRGHDAITSVMYSESTRLEPGPEKSNLNAFGNVLHLSNMFQDCTSQITYNLRIFYCSPFRFCIPTHFLQDMRTSAMTDLPAATLLSSLNNYCPYIL